MMIIICLNLIVFIAIAWKQYLSKRLSFYLLIFMKQLPTQQQLHKIRQQLSRIESQIQRNQQMFTDITIDNKTGKEIKLLMHLEHHHLNIQSRINLPNNSSITHNINQESNYEKTIHKNQSLPLHEQLAEQRRYDLYHSRNNHLSVSRQYQQLSSTRLQQKFQPIIRQNVNNHTDSQKLPETPQKQQILSSKKSSTNKIEVLTHEKEQIFAQYEAQGQQLNNLVQSKFIPITDRKADQILIQDSHTSKILQQTISPIPLPYSILNQKNQEILPHKYNTQAKQQQQQSKHSQAKISQLNWSIHSLERSSLKQPKESLNPQWKIDRITPSPKRILNFQAKTYKERSNQKRSLNKDINQQRQKSTKQRLATEHTYRPSKSRNKENIAKEKEIAKIADSTKADDLFQKRKRQCLNKLDKQRKLINVIRRNERQRSLSANTINQYPKQKKSVKHQSDPLVQQITTRLHFSKINNPCDRFKRFSESQQKQRFTQLVNENTFVCRYLSNNEKEQLFQRLRKSKDSVNVWPIKIANQAYSKLKRITNPIKTS